jgi:hypothetical protein
MTRPRTRALVDVANGAVDAGMGGQFRWTVRPPARSRAGQSATRACNELYDAGLIDIDVTTGRAALTDTGRAAMRLAYAWR